MSGPRLWHGGLPGLRVGDVLTGGNVRPVHAGCAFCAARAAGAAIVAPDGSAIDAPSAEPDRIYVTTSREYARFYASMYGRGDLYRVDPVDPSDLRVSPEDHFPSWTTQAARVVAVYDRAVQLTWTQRRSLLRAWELADEVAAAGAHPIG